MTDPDRSARQGSPRFAPPAPHSPGRTVVAASLGLDSVGSQAGPQLSSSSQQRQSPAPPHHSHASQQTENLTTAQGQLQRLQQDDEPSTQQPPEFPPFRPLYTVLTTTTARGTSTHHPRVHYVFSDDDPDELTEAFARHHVSLAPDAAEDDPSPASSDTGSGHLSSARPRHARPQRDRAVVLDLVPREDGSGGYDVAWASSLSDDWAVVGARVTRMDGGDEGGGVGAAAGAGIASTTTAAGDNLGDGLMLRIEGVGPDFGVAGSASPAGGSVPYGGELRLSGGSGTGRRHSAQPAEDYGALVEEFDQRMTVLTKVVDSARDRARVLGLEVGAETEPAETTEKVEIEQDIQTRHEAKDASGED